MTFCWSARSFQKCSPRTPCMPKVSGRVQLSHPGEPEWPPLRIPLLAALFSKGAKSPVVHGQFTTLPRFCRRMSPPLTLTLSPGLSREPGVELMFQGGGGATGQGADVFRRPPILQVPPTGLWPQAHSI